MQDVTDAFTQGLTAHPEDWHMMQRVFTDDGPAVDGSAADGAAADGAAADGAAADSAAADAAAGPSTAPREG
jgi:hypothetical protein